MGELPPLPFATPERDESALADIFAERLIAVGGECSVVTGQAEAAAAVRGVVGMERRVAWSDAELLGAIRRTIAGVERPSDAKLDPLLDAEFGITAARWAIAETGTIVLDARVERCRLVSLLPPIHVALVRGVDLVGTMAEALLRAAEGGAGPGPALTFVTGPSRTADIELTLVVGVHGPKRLHVVIMR